MFNNLIEFLLSGGVDKTTILLLLFLPIFLNIVNFFKYIVGFKLLGFSVTLAVFYILYSTRFEFFTVEQNLGISNEFAYTFILFSGASLVSVNIFKFIKGFRMHYMTQVSISLISLLISLLLLLLIAISLQDYVLNLFRPEYIILLVIICENMISGFAHGRVKTILAHIIEVFITASIAHILISWSKFEDLLLYYPFISLVAIVLNWIISKYTGLRILEILRFKEILEQEQHEDIEDITK